MKKLKVLSLTQNMGLKTLSILLSLSWASHALPADSSQSSADASSPNPYNAQTTPERAQSITDSSNTSSPSTLPQEKQEKKQLPHDISYTIGLKVVQNARMMASIMPFVPTLKVGDSLFVLNKEKNGVEAEMELQKISTSGKYALLIIKSESADPNLLKKIVDDKLLITRAEDIKKYAAEFNQGKKKF